jgi:hypothetical protein
MARRGSIVGLADELEITAGVPGQVLQAPWVRHLGCFLWVSYVPRWNFLPPNFAAAAHLFLFG